MAFVQQWGSDTLRVDLPAGAGDDWAQTARSRLNSDESLDLLPENHNGQPNERHEGEQSTDNLGAIPQ